jgi:hypothetical protein
MARSRLLRQAAVNHNRRIHHRVPVAILLRRTRLKRVAVAAARNHRIRPRQPRRRRVRAGRGPVGRAKPIENWPRMSASFFASFATVSARGKVRLTGCSQIPLKEKTK